MPSFLLELIGCVVSKVAIYLICGQVGLVQEVSYQRDTCYWVSCLLYRLEYS